MQILIDRGWANDALKQLDAAARDLGSVLRASPTNAEALAGLGYVRARQRQDIDAQRNASLAILHAADDYRILHNVACIYAELSRSAGAMKAEQEDTPLNLLRAALDRSQTIGGNESVAIQSEPAFVGTINQRQEFRELLSR